jgi:AcrR family transcriptional regulator
LSALSESATLDGVPSVEQPAHVSARTRVRAELTREIVETARRQLAVGGAAGLSLRAVARELGMVSSAVYRYVPSRDDLLTRLIIEAYDALGAAAEAAEVGVPRDDLLGRFRAITRAVRGWAVAHPHEYALVYGSPVPGYRAPEDTIGPATRVPALLIAVLADAVAAGWTERTPAVSVPKAVRRAIAPVRGSFPPQVTDDLLVRGLMAWTYLFGAVSFEVFGHRHNVVDNGAAFFDHEMARIATMLGLLT